MYLHIDGDSACLVTITEVYRYAGINYYSIDMSQYHAGLELEWVSERVLTKKVSHKSEGFVSRSRLKKIIEEYEQ